jgi:hypothetical protein
VLWPLKSLTGEVPSFSVTVPVGQATTTLAHCCFALSDTEICRMYGEPYCNETLPVLMMGLFCALKVTTFTEVLLASGVTVTSTEGDVPAANVPSPE